MARTKSPTWDLLEKALEKYAFTSINKSELKVGDHFVDKWNSLKVVTGRGQKGVLVVLSYEGDPALDLVDVQTAENSQVTLVGLQPKAKRNPMTAPLSGTDLAGCFGLAIKE